MGNNIDVRGIVKDLSQNDPEFLTLSPDQQDMVIERISQKNYNTIPSSEKVLSRASKDIKPFFAASDIPQIAFQTAQGPIANLPQNIVENPFATAISGPQLKAGAQSITGLKKLFFGGDSIKPETTEFSDKYLEPKTMGGKILGTIGNIASGMAVPLGAGIKHIDDLSPMSTMIKQLEVPMDEANAMSMLKGLQAEDVAPLLGNEKKAMGIKELISGKLKQIKTPSVETPKINKQELDSVLYSGKKDIASNLEKVGKEYTDRFGEGLSKINSSAIKADIGEIVNKTISELPGGTVDLPGTSANKLQNYLKKLIPENAEYDPMTANDIQATHKEIMRVLGKDTNARIKYNNNLLELLPDNVPGLKELKAKYAPKFELFRGVKSELTTGALRKVAKGEAAPERIKTMEDFANRIKSQSVSRAKDFSAKTTAQSESALSLSKELGLKADEAKAIGEARLSKVDAYIKSLGNKKEEVLSGHKAEIEDLANQFGYLRESLGKEKIEKYKRLAIVATLLSLANIGKVRSFLKEKF